MKIAVFVETYTPMMGANRRQTMIVPHGEDVRVYSRMSDGQKGLQSKWEETNIDALVMSIDASEHITNVPVGVRLTENDRNSLDDKGYAPVLNVKAVSAHLKSPQMTEQPDVIDELMGYYESVRNQSPELSDMVIDGRSAKTSTTPFIAQPEPQPTQTMAAPVVDRIHAVALASVPPIEAAKKYVHRTIHGLEDFEIFDRARSEKLDVLIYGPTGPGKTTSVIAWSAERRLRLAQVSGNAALEPSHLFGKYIPDGVGGFVWVDGPVTDVVRNGGTLILDEINFISPKIYTVLYSLLDNRRCLILLDHKGETIEAHPDLTIYATMNPSYIGTTPLNFAFRNRFAVQIPWDYDDKVESKLIKSHAILTVAKQLRTEAGKGEFETPISTNMLMEFESFIKMFNYEFAVENFIAHFELDEQDKVRLVFTTHEHNIKEDFGLVEEVVIDQPEDVESAKVADEAENWLHTNTPTV